jgi:hypothetical protein
MTTTKTRACYRDKEALSRAFGKSLDAFIVDKVKNIRGGFRKGWYWLEVEYFG